MTEATARYIRGGKVRWSFRSTLTALNFQFSSLPRDLVSVWSSYFVAMKSSKKPRKSLNFAHFREMKIQSDEVHRPLECREIFKKTRAKCWTLLTSAKQIQSDEIHRSLRYPVKSSKKRSPFVGMPWDLRKTALNFELNSSSESTFSDFTSTLSYIRFESAR